MQDKLPLSCTRSRSQLGSRLLKSKGAGRRWRFEWRQVHRFGILSRDERSRREIARGVQHRGEEIWNGVDGDQNPDPLGWQAEGEEEWREHDERAARDARDAEGEEDCGEGDQGQAAEVERDAVEPADE